MFTYLEFPAENEAFSYILPNLSYCVYYTRRFLITGLLAIDWATSVLPKTSSALQWSDMLSFGLKIKNCSIYLANQFIQIDKLIGI